MNTSQWVWDILCALPCVHGTVDKKDGSLKCQKVNSHVSQRHETLHSIIATRGEGDVGQAWGGTGRHGSLWIELCVSNVGVTVSTRVEVKDTVVGRGWRNVS